MLEKEKIYKTIMSIPAKLLKNFNLKVKKTAIISGCHQATYKGKVRPEQLDKCQREL